MDREEIINDAIELAKKHVDSEDHISLALVALAEEVKALRTALYEHTKV